MGTQDTLILLSKGAIYHTYKFFRFIILYLRVNVHRCLAVFMPSKILDSFWINASVQQVSNIGVAKLMWGHIKVNGIHQLRIVFLVFPRGGCYGAFDALAIYILKLDSVWSNPDKSGHPLQKKNRSQRPSWNRKNEGENAL